jgi:hypothetical protein
MRAVTVVSPEFERLGFEAAHRFWQFTGIDVDVVRCSAGDSHRVKLETLRDAAKSDWRFFFDADCWLVRPCHEQVRALLGPWVAGAPIPGVMADFQAREYGFDPRCRITSGFLAIDPNLPHWDAALRLALELQLSDPNRDEVFLNSALHHFHLPVRVIDGGWNWYLSYPYGYQPNVIWAVHAGGCPVSERFPMLEQAAKLVTTDTWGLDDPEVAWLGKFARILVARGMQRVVEFGPGRSTGALLAAGCRVTSCETSPQYFCALRAAHAGESNLTLLLTRHEPGLSHLNAAADWAVVDGPLGSLQVDGKARWHQLTWSAARCGLILLHDSKRDGEQRSIQALRAEGWNVIDIETPRGFSLLWRGCEDVIEVLQPSLSFP